MESLYREGHEDVAKPLIDILGGGGGGGGGEIVKISDQ